jgi:hypothetical protein
MGPWWNRYRRRRPSLKFEGADTVTWLINRHGVLAALLGVLAVVTQLLLIALQGALGNVLAAVQSQSPFLASREQSAQSARRSVRSVVRS